MIGMSFLSFLVLLVIGVVVAAVLHFLVRYRFLKGVDAFLGKIALGWIGGWIGSPVLGHWAFQVGDVYIIPAIIGAIVTVFLSTLLGKALAAICTCDRAEKHAARPADET